MGEELLESSTHIILQRIVNYFAWCYFTKLYNFHVNSRVKGLIEISLHITLQTVVKKLVLIVVKIV